MKIVCYFPLAEVNMKNFICYLIAAQIGKHTYNLIKWIPFYYLLNSSCYLSLRRLSFS